MGEAGLDASCLGELWRYGESALVAYPRLLEVPVVDSPVVHCAAFPAGLFAIPDGEGGELSAKNESYSYGLSEKLLALASKSVVA